MTSMVVGVDTHKATHSAALLNELGVVQGGLEAAASAAGYRQMLGWARSLRVRLGSGSWKGRVVTALAWQLI